VDEVTEELTDRSARLRAPDGGWTLIDRDRQRTCFQTPAPPAGEAIVHPYLSSTAVVAGHWLGRTVFHGGAVEVGGRAWIVVGGRESGKSSLLHGLHVRSVAVLADDVAVVDAGQVLAGPRCLDLRRSAAEHFGAGRPIGQIGRRERWRVDLPPAPTSVPLAGWVALGWADDPDVVELAPPDRLRLLLGHRALRAPAVTPNRILELTAYPAVVVARPRRWNQFDRSLGVLLDRLASF
jgi:hypothetical protein